MSVIAPHGTWAYDFVFDTWGNAQQLTYLTGIDKWTRDSLAIVPAARMRATDVINVHTKLFKDYGVPSFIRNDNGLNLSQNQSRNG